MKIRIEISEGLPDEIIIRCSKLTDEILRVQNLLQHSTNKEILLTLNEEDFFLPLSEILFFETENKKVVAHTVDGMYYSEEKLFELERSLPEAFVRISKSCIINSERIESVKRGVTGTAEAKFSGTHKSAYISRMYYKNLMDTIYEKRLKK